jgi:hypothetical protein
MSFNNYFNYQFSFLEKREKNSYYVKLSLRLHELPTSERLNHNKRPKKKKGTFRFFVSKNSTLVDFGNGMFYKSYQNLTPTKTNDKVCFYSSIHLKRIIGVNM